MFKRSTTVIFLLGCLAVLLAAACGGGSSAIDKKVTQEDLAISKPTIVIAQNETSLSAQLSTAVVKKLIESAIRYPVEIRNFSDVSSMLSSLEKGDVDASIEVWPSEVERVEDQELLESELIRSSPLGVAARKGWYVPGYVLESYPGLENWRGFENADIAGNFASIATAPNGRFLGTDEAKEFDADIIRNTELPLEVVYSGGLEATREELEKSVISQTPIVLHASSLDSLVEKFDLQIVETPTIDNCRIVDAASVACEYKEEQLVKLVSTQLASTSVQAEEFIENFMMTNEDILTMLRQVESEGMTVDDAAAAWIESNGETWSKWLQE